MSPDAGWYADPSGQKDLRWWDGVSWTDHVQDDPNQRAAPASPPPTPSTPTPGAPAAPDSSAAAATGTDPPWWAQNEGGQTPSWWTEPQRGIPQGSTGPSAAPFHPIPDPAYAETYSRVTLARAQGALPALLWGIAAIICCGPIGGAIALYQGSQARYRIRVSNGRLGGNGMALAGMVLGGLAIAYWILSIFLIATGRIHINTGSGTTP